MVRRIQARISDRFKREFWMVGQVEVTSRGVTKCSNRPSSSSQLTADMFCIGFTRSLRDALPTTVARCVSTARMARLPPIPIGPSSSRWASTYVHLGELADNKGARGDVSHHKEIKRSMTRILIFDRYHRTFVSVVVGRLRKVEHPDVDTRDKRHEQETANQRLGSRVVKHRSRGCSRSEDSTTCA
jgi:hypothetical protein